MNKTLRNFWIDIILFVLLGLNAALICFNSRTPAGIHPGWGWHAHAFISILLTSICLIHIALHWRWFLAALTGKAKGRVKLIMNSLVVLTMLIANLSGHAIMESGAASTLHDLTGIFAMLGMFVHGVKHVHWMAITAKRLTGDRQTLRQMQPSE